MVWPGNLFDAPAQHMTSRLNRVGFEKRQLVKLRTLLASQYITVWRWPSITKAFLIVHLRTEPENLPTHSIRDFHRPYWTPTVLLSCVPYIAESPSLPSLRLSAKLSALRIIAYWILQYERVSGPGRSACQTYVTRDTKFSTTRMSLLISFTTSEVTTCHIYHITTHLPVHWSQILNHSPRYLDIWLFCWTSSLF